MILECFPTIFLEDIVQHAFGPNRDKKGKKSKQQQLSRNQGPEMQFQHTLGRTFIFGGRLLNLINSDQTEGEKDTKRGSTKTPFEHIL